MVSQLAGGVIKESVLIRIGGRSAAGGGARGGERAPHRTACTGGSVPAREARGLTGQCGPRLGGGVPAPAPCRCACADAKAVRIEVFVLGRIVSVVNSNKL